MLKNYLKIAWRNLLKYKGYSFINITGMSIGLSISLTILIYAFNELSYDNFHTNGNRIYRVTTNFLNPGSGLPNGGIETNGWGVGRALKNTYPEVEQVVYSRSAQYLSINFNNKKIQENAHFFNSAFFETFSFNLLKGNKKTALTDPFSIVLTKSLEAKYFGNGSGLGQTLVMEDTLVFKVTGIMEDIPKNSHIQLDMILSFSTYELINPYFTYDGGWGNINIRNYILLAENAHPGSFFDKAKNVYMDNAGEQLARWGMICEANFEPLEELYLQSGKGNGLGPIGSIDRLYLVIAISAFIMLLACINFINLSTARSVYRAREVGLRKVAGSGRASLIFQFLFEAFFLVLISFVVSIIFLQATLPYFNDLLNRSFTLEILLDARIIFSSLLMVLLVSFLSGYYPAVLISSMKPGEVLKGSLAGGEKGVFLRKALVVFQYFISSAMIIATLIVIQQLRFMHNTSLGFEKENVMVVNLADISSVQRLKIHDSFKNEILQNPDVDAVSYANAFPGHHGWRGQMAHPEGFEESENISVHFMTVDPDYANILGLEVVSGRFFDSNRISDLEKGLVINETAAYQMGWTPQTAPGKHIVSPSKSPEGIVIGVVKDYHQSGLQENIKPIVMDVRPQTSYLFLIKQKGNNIKGLLADLEILWNERIPEYEFDYYFMEDFYNNQYKSEIRLQDTFALFSIVTIVIASIGLVGLISFVIIGRHKEIGIRKVFGAPSISISYLVSRQFIGLILLGNILSVPTAWYFGEKWLNNYAYKAGLPAEIFVGTILFTLFLALITVSYQTIRASLIDPAKILSSQ